MFQIGRVPVDKTKESKNDGHCIEMVDMFTSIGKPSEFFEVAIYLKAYSLDRSSCLKTTMSRTFGVQKLFAAKLLAKTN